MASRSRLFSKIAKDVGSDGNLTAAALSSDVSFGATVYDSTGVLPYSGNDTGDQAYVKDNNRFYIWDSSGWYNVALINRAPAISSVQDSDGNTTPFTLSDEGDVTTITITATDSDGDLITYSASPDAGFNGLGTVTNDGNVFTITPFSADSASTESGTITFKATDGINIASSGVQSFTLVFLSEYWKDVALSVGTSSTNSLANSTFIDRSTNAHTVTPTGSPVQTAFHPYLDNWSNYLGDNADHAGIVTQSDASLTFGTGDFTVEAWVYLTDTNPTNSTYSLGILDARHGSTALPSLYITNGSGSTGQIRVYMGSSDVLTGPTINRGQWYHVALSRESSNFRLFVDGVLEDTTTNSTNYTNTVWTIGARYAEANSDWRTWQGNISNVRFVKGTALYTSTFTPPTEKLTAVSGTSLLTCQSNRFVDNSSNEHAITVNGDQAISAYNPFGQESEYAAGENKGSLYNSSGYSNYITLGSNDLRTLGNVDWTWEAWVYPTSLSNMKFVTTRSGGEGYEFFIYWSGLWGFEGYGSQNTAGQVRAATVFPANQWYHIAYVNNSTETRLYVNGVETASKANSYTWISSVDNRLFGAYDFPEDAAGYVSDMKFTFSEVYTTNFTPPAAPLGNTNAKLYVPMDNAGIFDKTGSAYITGDAVTSTTQNKFADTSIYFDGSEKLYVEDHNVDFAASTPFTVEFWLYGNGGGGLISWTGVRDQLDTTLLIAFDDSLAFYSGSYITPTGQSSLTGSQWNHIAMVRGTDNYIRLYLNGTLYSTSSSTFTSRIKKPIELGGYATTRFTGYMENLQMLPGVAKYTSNFTPPTGTQGRTYQAED